MKLDNIWTHNLLYWWLWLDLLSLDVVWLPDHNHFIARQIYLLAII